MPLYMRIPVRLLATCIALLVAVPWAACAGNGLRAPRFHPLSPAAREAARSIQEGTREFLLDGVPGELAVYGPDAFPLVRDSRGRDVAAVVADPVRRAVVLTHDCWFKEATLAKPDVRRLLENAVTWLLSGRRSGRVLCFGAYEMPRLLAARGLAVDAPRSFPDSLDGYDAVVLYVPTSYSQSFTERSAELLRQAFEGGLPVMAASIGWVYEAYGEGKKGSVLETDFAGNRVFSPRGISFLPDMADAKAYPVPAADGEHRIHAALGRAAGLLRGEERLGTEAARAFLKDLQARAARIPDWHIVMGAGEMAGFASSVAEAAAGLVPTEDRPVRLEDAPRSTAIVLATLMTRRHPEAFRGLYPFLGGFPGRAAAAGTSVGPSTIDMRVPGWQSLGVYANAGELLRVEVPGLQAADRVVLRIGCHADDLVASGAPEDWKRWPVVTQTRRLAAPVTEVLSCVSGPVYLDVPVAVAKAYGDGRKAELFATVRGGVPMPVFRLGRGDPAAFLREAAATPSPLVEVQGRSVSFTVPRGDLPPGFDPLRIMEWWDRAVASILDLAGREPYGYPLRFVADVQPSTGYMHSGYPIVTHPDVASYQLGGRSDTAEWKKQTLLANGAWGHFHEMGHMVQSPAYTFTGAGEVTVNLFTLYAMQVMTGVRPLEHPYLTPYRKAVDAYRAAPDWEAWKKQPFLALHTYAYLVEAFGWDALRAVLLAFRDMPQETRPKTDAEKTDAWVRAYSRAAERNLVPYFRSWAWPVSDALERELSDLPAWRG